MAFLVGPMRLHIFGNKKLTKSSATKFIKAGKEVSIPLYATHSTKFDVLVNEGDHVKVGTKIAQCNDKFVIPIYSSVSGTVKGIKKIMHASLKPLDHIVIENDEKMEEIQSFSILDYQRASREELIERMKESGIIGQGGAGFPSYAKYDHEKEIQTLIINAVECEPYITADYSILKDHMNEVLLGVLAMRKMAQAKEAIIAIKQVHKELIEQLQSMVVNLKGISIRVVPDVYPMGWERTLIQQIMKKDYQHLPSEIGVVVNNVTTAYAFANALTKGKAVVEKVVTISGDAIKQPQNIACPIGVSVHEIVEACGGYNCEEVRLIAGGPMMGKAIVNDSFVIDRFMNAITILKNKEIESIACLRCGKCSDYCPVGLQPVRIAQSMKANNKEMMAKLHTLDCVECGMCTYVCPSKIDVTENVRKAKRQLTLAKK